MSAGVAARYLQTHLTATPSFVTYALRAAATAGAITNPGTGTPNLLAYAGLFGTQPTNLPPIASYDFSCTALGCAFDSNGSQDDVGIVSRSWVFGDGSTGSGLTPQHVYPAGATYNVTLTVADGSGATNAISKRFTLPAVGGRAGAPPKPDFTA